MAKITTVVQKEDLIQSPLNDANKVKASDINKIVQTINVNDDLLSEKTEKGGYTGTTQDLKDELNTAVFTGATTYQTEAELLAVSPIPANGTPAKVANDPTSSKNGNYSVVSGAWVQDSSIIDNITVSEDIKTDADKLLFSDRSKQVIPESTEIASLGYKFIRSDFDFTSIPSGYDNATWEIKDYFDLGGATINLPTNVTLFFNGGKFSNGTIVGDNTDIEVKSLVNIFNADIVLQGDFNSSNTHYVWFGDKTYNTVGFQKMLDFISINKNKNAFLTPYAKYLLDDCVISNSDINIIGNKAIIKRSTENPSFTFNAIADSYNVSSIVDNVGSTKLYLSDTSDFNIGDTVKVWSTDFITNMRFNERMAEFATVRRVYNTYIEISGSLRYNYITNVKVALQSKHTCNITDIKITSDNEETSSDAVATILKVNGGMYHSFKDIEVLETLETGVVFEGCYAYDVQNFKTNYQKNKADADGSSDKIGYGIVDRCGGYFSVNYNNRYTRHGFTTNAGRIGGSEGSGISEFGTILNSKSIGGSNAGFDLHEEAYAMSIINCKGSKSNGFEVQVRGDNNVVNGCEIIGGNNGIYIFNYSGTTNVGNHRVLNTIVDTIERPLQIQSPDSILEGIEILNSSFTAYEEIGITNTKVIFKNCIIKIIDRQSFITANEYCEITFQNCTFILDENTITFTHYFVNSNPGAVVKLTLLNCNIKNIGSVNVLLKGINFVGDFTSDSSILIDNLFVYKNSNINLSNLEFDIQKWTNKNPTFLTEVVLNGDFSSWTGGNPDSWVVVNESTGNEVSEVVNGARVTYSTGGTDIQLRQTVLTLGSFYYYSIDVVNTIGSLKIQTGGATSIELTNGSNVGSFIADGSLLLITRNSSSSDADVLIENISIKNLTDDDINVNLSPLGLQ